MKQFQRHSRKQGPAEPTQNGSSDQDQVVAHSQDQAAVPAGSADPYLFSDPDSELASPGAAAAAPERASTPAQQAQAPADAKPALRQPVSAAAAAAGHQLSKKASNRAGGTPPKRAKAAAAAAASGPPSTTAAGASSAGSKRLAPPPSPPRPAASGSLGQAAAATAAAGSGGAANRRRQGGSSGGTRAASNTAAGSGAGRAASGGSRAASGGGKRSKCNSPSIDNLPGSPVGQQQPAAAAATADKKAAGGSVSAVSLPTPRRPVGLIPAGLLAAVESRPAQTVMEAQERGELVQMQDDARYAMDGLAATCSIDTQRESAVALTDMLSSRKGRLALRADGLAQQVLSSLAKVKAAKDCVLGLASTIVLLMLTSEDAHPTYLASIAAAVLMDQLLQSNYTFDEVASCCPSGARLARMLKVRPLSGLLASTGVSSHRELLLITLEQATSCQQASKVAAVERLKHNLRQYGALTRLGKLIAEAAGQPVPAARQLHLLLLVLENATFTCQENGQALVQLQVSLPRGSSGTGGESQWESQQQQQQSFPGLLVHVAQQLLGIDDEECRQALHVCLSVLMNLSHQNPEGAGIISAAGGMQAAAGTIIQLLAPMQHSHQALCQQVLQHLELISVALGVLINLVSGEPANSRELAAMPSAGGSQEAALAGSSGSSSMDVPASGGLVPLLCTVMAAVGQLLQQEEEREEAEEAGDGEAAAAAARGVLARRSGAAAAGSSGMASPAAAGEGLDDNSAGEASIVEVYCGMLLGFLVRDCAELAASVAQMMEDKSLQPIVGAVQRCLNFYVSTGAITEHTRTTLEELLQHLSSCGV